MIGDNEEFLRKYMYVYGGFSYLCHTACYDLWRYEIPWTPLAMAPRSKTVNAGNHWEQVQDDVDSGPGKRWKVVMVTYQRKKDDYNDKAENYIYLFGGIKVIDAFDLEELTIADITKTTSYIFMSDLWKFDLLSNVWQEVEVYGISEITRNLFLWNGTRVTMDV